MRLECQANGNDEHRSRRVSVAKADQEAKDTKKCPAREPGSLGERMNDSTAGGGGPY